MFLARPEVSRNSVHGYSVMGCCLAPHNHWFGLARISLDPSEHVFQDPGTRVPDCGGAFENIGAVFTASHGAGTCLGDVPGLSQPLVVPHAHFDGHFCELGILGVTAG